MTFWDSASEPDDPWPGDLWYAGLGAWLRFTSLGTWERIK